MPLTDMRGEPVVAGKWYWARTNDKFLQACTEIHIVCGIWTGQFLKTTCDGLHTSELWTDFVPAELPKEYEKNVS